MISSKQTNPFLSCFLVALVSSCAGRGAPAPALPSVVSERPNIVFVLVDDMRWDDLGYAGHPFSKTPHIDRIAAEGANFRNAFATTPLCSPSRASILTGLYTHSHGIIDNTERGPQSHALKTFPQALKKAGYRTGFVGKWHMGNDDTPRPGFDDWIGLAGQGRMFDTDINDNGRTRKSVGHVTDVLNEEAANFVKRQRPGAPFMLYFAHKAIHPDLKQAADGRVSDPTGGGQFIPAERHKTLFENAAIPRRANYGKAPVGKPALQRKIGDLPPLGPGTVTPDDHILNRLRMLTAIDEGVGKIRKALEEMGQLDGTMFIVTSDHGYFYGEHGLNFERRLAYEEASRIALVVRYPPLVKAGSVIDEYVLNTDSAPTLMEVAGAAGREALDGRSWLPLLRGGGVPWRKSFLIEYYSDRVWPRVLGMGYRAVRTEKHKLIHYTDAALKGMEELYDLEQDPYEMTNIIATPQGKAALPALWAEMARLCPRQCPELQGPPPVPVARP